MAYREQFPALLMQDLLLADDDENLVEFLAHMDNEVYRETKKYKAKRLASDDPQPDADNKFMI